MGSRAERAATRSRSLPGQFRRARVCALTAIAWTAIGLCGLGACSESRESTGPDRIELDLIELRETVLRRNPALEVVVEAEGSRIVQQGSGGFDLFVAVPESGSLDFGVTPDTAPPELHVSIETPEGTRALDLQQDAAGRWRSPLDTPGPARLRFENRSDRPLAWIEPRLAGHGLDTAAVLGTRASPPSRPVNVLLYVIDTLRHDHVSAYGYDRPTTPNLDRLAERAFLFEQAYAPGASTLPSVSAMFTSRHPILAKEAFRNRDKTLAEAFQQAGYHTMAFQANPTVFPKLGFARGFDEYRVVPSAIPERSTPFAEELHAPVLEWLQNRPEGPFFLYVQSMDVHDYRPPPAYQTLFADLPAKDQPRDLLVSIDNYDRTIAYGDAEIGKLMAELPRLGLEQNTIVLITSDHGEPLRQHAHFMHGTSVYEELMHIPLILILPWHAGGVRVQPVVSLVDVGPTLLELAGVPVPEKFAGHSWLHPYPASEPPTAVGVKTKWLARKRKHGRDEWYLRRGPWKLILDETRIRLFHLPTDPGELTDVRAEHPILAAYLASELMVRSPVFERGLSEMPPLDDALAPEEQRRLEEALRNLGYME